MQKRSYAYLLEIEDTPGLKIHVFAYDKLTYSDFRDPLFMSTTFIEMLIKNNHLTETYLLPFI